MRITKIFLLKSDARMTCNMFFIRQTLCGDVCYYVSTLISAVCIIRWVVG